jgi:hypothetical protein
MENKLIDIICNNKDCTYHKGNITCQYSPITNTTIEGNLCCLSYNLNIVTELKRKAKGKCVVMQHYNPSLEICKVLKNISGFGLREAKKLHDNSLIEPTIIMIDVENDHIIEGIIQQFYEIDPNIKIEIKNY